MTEAFSLPVGPTPDWEEADEHGLQLSSVSESYVLLQSLRQSRERWLTSAFAKFSTRARGKQPEVIPPPHTATLLGRCDLEIGPHTFHGTALFEIQFHQPVYGAGPAGSLLLPSATASAFNSAAHLPPPPAVERAVASATASPTRTTSPISSVFLSHISQTAATNPQLAELLHLSATQRATGEQIRTLGLIIQAMAAAPPPPRVQAEFVLEFRERAADRWLVPRHLAVCERRTLSAGADGPFAILITTALFPTSVLQVDATGNYAEAARNPQPVTLRLTNATHAMWEFVQRWISYDKVDENSRVLDKLAREAERVYLQLRLPEGPLLSKMQNLANPAYPTRSINPAENPRERRKVAPRKAQPAVAPEAPSPRVDKGNEGAADPEMERASSQGSIKWKGKEKDSGKGKERAHNDVDIDSTPRPPPAKRQRASQVKPKEKSTPPVIACQTCNMTDVPLMLGGRYCRECIDKGTAPPSTIYVKRQTYPPHATTSAGKS